MGGWNSIFPFREQIAQVRSGIHHRPPRLQVLAGTLHLEPTMYAIPKPGRSVPIPGTRTLLPATGQNIGPVTQYWQRRLYEGDITLSETPPTLTSAGDAAESAAATNTAASTNTPPPPTLPTTTDATSASQRTT
ncbi:DUF2635 domain-containing protein [Xanthomonas albilineans]|uniref:DUF2635 domain-containing protein n=1 Tax=Xanthomonas albilineans TaxID=29447 RepID=UPI003CCE993D